MGIHKLILYKFDYTSNQILKTKNVTNEWTLILVLSVILYLLK